MDEAVSYISEHLLEIISLVVTGAGFTLVLYQAHKAVGAARAARNASEAAVRDIASALTLADTTATAKTLWQLQQDLMSTSVDVALLRCQLARTEIHKLRKRAEFDNPEMNLEIRRMITGMKRIEEQIQEAADGSSDSLNLPRINGKLSEYAYELIEWGESLMFRIGRAQNDPGRD